MFFTYTVILDVEHEHSLLCHIYIYPGTMYRGWFLKLRHLNKFILQHKTFRSVLSYECDANEWHRFRKKQDFYVSGYVC